MKLGHTLLSFTVVLMLTIVFSTPAQNTVWVEKSGILVMEMENSKSPVGLWVKKNDGSDWSGTGFYEFTGNTINGGDPKSPLEFRFKITKAGIYGIHLHAFNRLDGAASDKCNDAYVKVDGDYTSGANNVPLAALQKDTKLYSSNSGNIWSWGFQLDGNGADHVAAKYNFKGGEEYLLTISGRSIRFQIDRILFAHNDVNLNDAKAAPESDTLGATPIINNPSQNKAFRPQTHISYINGLLKFNDLRAGAYLMMVTALNGKTVIKKSLYVSAKGNATASLELSRIANGLYITSISGHDLFEGTMILVNK